MIMKFFRNIFRGQSSLTELWQVRAGRRLASRDDLEYYIKVLRAEKSLLMAALAFVAEKPLDAHEFATKFLDDSIWTDPKWDDWIAIVDTLVIDGKAADTDLYLTYLTSQLHKA